MDLDRIGEMTVENAVAIGKLIEISKRTSEDIDRMIKHSEKLDKLSQEHSTILGRVGHLETTVTRDRGKLKYLYTITDYPKSSVALLVSAWLTTFYEVRHAVGIQLQPLVDAINYIKEII